MTTLAFIQNMSMMEWLIILALGLLLFGRRLPEVGRSLGKGIVEFKKGLSGMEDEVNTAVQRQTQPPANLPPPQQQYQSSTPPPPPRVAAPQTAGGGDARVSRADVVD
jgi:sec-independent protein translocase protein TatA